MVTSLKTGMSVMRFLLRNIWFAIFGFLLPSIVPALTLAPGTQPRPETKLNLCMTYRGSGDDVTTSVRLHCAKGDKILQGGGYTLRNLGDKKSFDVPGIASDGRYWCMGYRQDNLENEDDEGPVSTLAVECLDGELKQAGQIKIVREDGSFDAPQMATNGLTWCMTARHLKENSQEPDPTGVFLECVDGNPLTGNWLRKEIPNISSYDVAGIATDGKHWCIATRSDNNKEQPTKVEFHCADGHPLTSEFKLRKSFEDASFDTPKVATDGKWWCLAMRHGNENDPNQTVFQCSAAPENLQKPWQKKIVRQKASYDVAGFSTDGQHWCFSYRIGQEDSEKQANTKIECSEGPPTGGRKILSLLDEGSFDAPNVFLYRTCRYAGESASEGICCKGLEKNESGICQASYEGKPTLATIPEPTMEVQNLSCEDELSEEEVTLFFNSDVAMTAFQELFSRAAINNGDELTSLLRGLALNRKEQFDYFKKIYADDLKAMADAENVAKAAANQKLAFKLQRQGYNKLRSFYVGAIQSSTALHEGLKLAYSRGLNQAWRCEYTNLRSCASQVYELWNNDQKSAFSGYVFDPVFLFHQVLKEAGQDQLAPFAYEKAAELIPRGNPLLGSTHFDLFDQGREVIVANLLGEDVFKDFETSMGNPAKEEGVAEALAMLSLYSFAEGQSTDLQKWRPVGKFEVPLLLLQKNKEFMENMQRRLNQVDARIKCLAGIEGDNGDGDGSFGGFDTSGSVVGSNGGTAPSGTSTVTSPGFTGVLADNFGSSGLGAAGAFNSNLGQAGTGSGTDGSGSSNNLASLNLSGGSNSSVLGPPTNSREKSLDDLLGRKRGNDSDADSASGEKVADSFFTGEVAKLARKDRKSSSGSSSSSNLGTGNIPNSKTNVIDGGDSNSNNSDFANVNYDDLGSGSNGSKSFYGGGVSGSGDGKSLYGGGNLRGASTGSDSSSASYGNGNRNGGERGISGLSLNDEINLVNAAENSSFVIDEENDSIFKVISKAYVKHGYKRVLANDLD